MRRPSAIVVGLALCGHLLATTMSGLWHRHSDVESFGRAECSCSHEDGPGHDDQVRWDAVAAHADDVGFSLRAARHADDDAHGCPVCHVLAQASTPPAALAVVPWQPAWRPAAIPATHTVVASSHTPPHCRAPPAIG